MKLERRLTADDKKALENYHFKTREIKQFTVACLRGTHTGLLLFGAGGNGKSYAIGETLAERGIREVMPEERDRGGDNDDDGENEDEHDEPAAEFGHDTFVVNRGRISPKGLVKKMAQFPASLHLIEDAETMFDDKNCCGVLRMALHSQDRSLHPKRRITWDISSDEGNYDFFFTGALIIVGNRVLNDKMEEIKAVKTRCPPLTFDVSNAELIAKMKEICERGYSEIPKFPLTPNNCYDVLEFILHQIEMDLTLKQDRKGNEKKLNMRLLDSGFRFMALSRMEKSVDWKAMLLSQMAEVVGASKRTRRERVRDEKDLAAELLKMKFKSQHDKLAEWCRMAGRDETWIGLPRDSAEYLKGFRAAKMDLQRKSK